MELCADETLDFVFSNFCNGELNGDLDDFATQIGCGSDSETDVASLNDTMKSLTDLMSPTPSLQSPSPSLGSPVEEPVGNVDFMATVPSRPAPPQAQQIHRQQPIPPQPVPQAPTSVPVALGPAVRAGRHHRTSSNASNISNATAERSTISVSPTNTQSPATTPAPNSAAQAFPPTLPNGMPMTMPAMPMQLMNGLFQMLLQQNQQNQPAAPQKVAISRLPASASKAVKIVTKSDKKVAHNAIERRYRNSINDRINQLKTMLPDCANSTMINEDAKDSGSDEKDEKGGPQKLHKATVLAKAIDYINLLQAQVKTLNDEKFQLLTELGRAPAAAAALGSLSSSSSSKRRADDAFDGEELVFSVKSEPGSETAAKRVRSMNDSKRLGMFVMIFACLAFSQSLASDMLGGTTSSTLHSSQIAGRGLNSYNDEGASTSLFSTLFWWGCQLLSVLACLALSFLSEPSCDTASASYQEAVNHERKASRSKSCTLAREHAEKALSALGRPLFTQPSFEMHLSLVWQIGRQLSHRMFFGRWLDSLICGRNQSVIASYDLAASCYHILYTTSVSTDRLKSLLYALSAMNLTEASAEHTKNFGRLAESSTDVSREFVTLSGALGLWLARRYYAIGLAAYRQALPSPSRASVSWLYEESDAQAIFFSSSTPSVASKDADSNSRHSVALTYIDSLLSLGFQNLCEYGKTDAALVKLESALHYAAVLKDSQRVWWAAVALVECFRRNHDLPSMSRMLVDVDAAAGQMDKLTSLQKGIRISFAAINHLQIDDGRSALSALESASRSMSLHEPKSYGPNAYQHAAATICLRNLMDVRLRLWQWVRRTKNEAVVEIAAGVLTQIVDRLNTGSQEDLRALSQIAEIFAPAHSSLLMYQGVVRSLAGAGSAQTVRLFQHSIQLSLDRSCAYDAGAAYLRMAQCQHALGYVEESRDSLDHATALFEKLHVKSEMNSCNGLARALQQISL